MNKRRIMTLALALCMVAVLAIGGTLAYFTDEDNAKNVMTIGNVQIIQQEHERTFDEDGNTTGLQEFTDDKVLMPVVGSAQGEKDQYGMPAVAKNYVDKIVTVVNQGKSDAWVRTFILMPKNLVVNDNGNLTETYLHMNIGNRFDETGASQKNNATTAATLADWDWVYDASAESVGTVTINGCEYAVSCYTVKAPLAAGDTTDPSIVGMYLDDNIDFDGTDYVYVNADGSETKITGIFETGSDKIVVYAYSQAVQSAGFEDSADKAFAAAGLNQADNVTPAIDFLEEDVTWN